MKARIAVFALGAALFTGASSKPHRQGSAIRTARAGAFARGGRQIVDAGGPTGRGGCGSTSMNTASYLSQTACACSVDSTMAPHSAAAVGAR